MRYSQDIRESIGRTPLVKINRLTKDEGIKTPVLAKMESLNPGYSVKDRIGISMIETAEKAGDLKPGGTLIEATSGNTGIGLALAAAVKGYKCIFVVTTKVSKEKIDYLKSLDAQVVECDVEAKPGTEGHYVKTAERLAKENKKKGWYYPDQYNDPVNPEAHYRTTGSEIWKGSNEKITHFVSGIGTGGTISGTGKFLKEQDPDIKVIGADPYGSIYKTYKETRQLTGGESYKVEGIGKSDITRKKDIPKNIAWDIIDEIFNVTDHDSFKYSRELSRVEGIFCGSSTGTNLKVALDVAKELDKEREKGLRKNGLVVFTVCDTGEHYLSKHHSDEWMRANGYLEP